ncbi:hypothetical protein J6497_20495 [Bradyrhizobium sp. CNPSo 4026]|nr:hypothetical protein [Bradyrhizobium cenepequi]
MSYIITPADLETCFLGFAQSLAHASGSLHLAELAVTASAIPGPLLADLSANSTISIRPSRRACCRSAPARSRLMA